MKIDEQFGVDRKAVCLASPDDCTVIASGYDASSSPLVDLISRNGLSIFTCDTDGEQSALRPEVDELLDGGNLIHTDSNNGVILHRSRWRMFRWKDFPISGELDVCAEL